MSCPCGNEPSFEECCGPYLAGDAKADTAETLMRSRYTAYTREDIDYIVATHDASSRDDIDREGAAQWAKQATWEALQIINTEGGGAEDDEGLVEFIARYQMEGQVMSHHERATFKRVDGEWFFLDGDIVKRKPVKREGKKVGRNEPCPCGSGKKYKKCCGK